VYSLTRRTQSSPATHFIQRFNFWCQRNGIADDKFIDHRVFDVLDCVAGEDWVRRDVAGRDCVMVDDMIDTGGTLCKAAEALKERGAKRVFAYAQIHRSQSF
jgi:hypothetical protein